MKYKYFVPLMYHLSTGVYLENHDDCMQFVKENYNSPKFISDHLPVYYLSACLTLWLVIHTNTFLTL